MTVTADVVLPERAGSRQEAQALVKQLRAPEGRLVVVDGGPLEASSASFIDEVVKLILVDAGAKSLAMHGASETVKSLALSSARRRGVDHRLRFR